MQEPHNLGLQLLGETGLLGLFAFAAVAYVVVRWGGGTIGAIALVVVISTAMTQTVLFEPTLWFSGALYLGKAGFDRTNLHSSDA
jgi:O-antigen ligase